MWRVLTLVVMMGMCGTSVATQAPSAPPAPSPAAPASPAQAPGSGQPQVFADMNQLMRGVLYPAANVVFSAQIDNPADATPAPGQDPSMSTNPLTSSYGGWTAIENAALALAESSNLLLIPGRSCANGVPAPTKDPAWVAFVQDVRNASMQAYAAAKAKADQEQMIALSETLSRSCSGCHRQWRDRRGGPGNRCK